MAAQIDTILTQHVVTDADEAGTEKQQEVCMCVRVVCGLSGLTD